MRTLVIITNHKRGCCGHHNPASVAPTLM